jgi:hypothetical protein
VNRAEREDLTMDPENNDQLFPVDDDDLLQFQEEDEEDDIEEIEMDFEEIMDDDLFDDPYIYLAIF